MKDFFIGLFVGMPFWGSMGAVILALFVIKKDKLKRG